MKRRTQSVRAGDSLSADIAAIPIVDVHEHLCAEEQRPQSNDVLAEWMQHYFSTTLVAAGLSLDELVEVCDPSGDLSRRRSLVEPCWQANLHMGYGRALALGARDIYGVDNVDAVTIHELDRRFCAARAAGGHYRRVLREMSGITLALRDLGLERFVSAGDHRTSGRRTANSK